MSFINDSFRVSHFGDQTHRILRTAEYTCYFRRERIEGTSILGSINLASRAIEAVHLEATRDIRNPL